jgi:hypothetical protein
MKKILYLGAIATLLSTTGCIVADGGGRHGEYGRHDAVVVGPPVVVVAAPAVVVRQPEVIVR